MKAMTSLPAQFALIAAPPTPFRSDGSLDTDIIASQLDMAFSDGLDGVFVCGTTGEFSSLTMLERMTVAETWCRCLEDRPMRCVVHVGSDCLGEAKELAAHAAAVGATGIAAMTPRYLKPADASALVDWCAEIAGAAADLPFQYYDIPSLTGLRIPCDRFVAESADRIPTLAGIKLSDPDLRVMQRCRAAATRPLEILYGCDELLLPALFLGADGAVGSTYNVVARLFREMLAAARRGDFESARRCQTSALYLIEALQKGCYLSGLKELLRWRGVDTGDVRKPLVPLTAEARAELREHCRRRGLLDLMG
jgi:N-acetylneuraminate lyase